MFRIIVHISGGVFQRAIADSPSAEIMVIDHDDIAAGDDLPGRFEPVDIDLSAFAIMKGFAPE